MCIHCCVFCLSPEECAGQFDLPILGGVDVVEYWNLPAGADPVLGKSTLMAFLGDYRFFFSTIENLRWFEVRNENSLQHVFVLAMERHLPMYCTELL